MCAARPTARRTGSPISPSSSAQKGLRQEPAGGLQVVPLSLLKPDKYRAFAGAISGSRAISGRPAGLLESACFGEGCKEQGKSMLDRERRYQDCLDQARQASSGGRGDEALGWLDEAIRVNPSGA